jgi:predicted DNA-binding transcriptional regulator YafY
MNRIDRLTAILIQLQSKRVVKAEEIAGRFEISLRTVYRDVKALMEAGVPIGSEAGKGYFIVDGYHLPPVMFTQEEASAMLMASKLVEQMTDKSVQRTFESALMKIKSVLHDNQKDHLENLQSYIKVFRYAPTREPEFPDSYLTEIQAAIVGKRALKINYCSNQNGEITERILEPIGLFYYSQAWHLIGWCRLRNGYRDFRTDRIQHMTVTNDTFDGRNLLSLQEYLHSLTEANEEVQQVRLLLPKPLSGYMVSAKHYYGYVSEEDLDTHVRMIFIASNMRQFCRGVLMMGDKVEIESPEEAKVVIQEVLEELNVHYNVERRMEARESARV